MSTPAFVPPTIVAPSHLCLRCRTALRRESCDSCRPSKMVALADKGARRDAAARLQLVTTRAVVTRNEVVKTNKWLQALLILIAFPGGLAALCAAAIYTVKSEYSAWFIPVMIIGTILWLFLWMLPMLATRRSKPEVSKQLAVSSVKPAVSLDAPDTKAVEGTIERTDGPQGQAVAALMLRRYGEVTFRCATSYGFVMATARGPLRVPSGDVRVEGFDAAQAEAPDALPKWLTEQAPEALEGRGLFPCDEVRRIILRQGDRVALSGRLCVETSEQAGYREQPDAARVLEGMGWLRRLD